MYLLSKVTGEGAPLILVPGGLTGWLDWDVYARVLAKTRKVIQVQLLNVQYGLENRVLPDDYSVKTVSRALGITLKGLGLSTALDIIAWSFGALVALDYALDNPSNIRSLILIEPPAFWVLRAADKSDTEVDCAVSFTCTRNEDITESELENFLQKVGICAPGQSARNLPQWPLWVRHRQSIRNTFCILKHIDTLKRLEAFTRPTLLVKGTGSSESLHHIIDILKNVLLSAQVIELPGKHSPQLVSFDLFLKLMKDFQESVQD